MHHALDEFDLPPETTRDRFAWAMRRGRPAWLWPDVEIDQWRRSLAVIESATRRVLTGDGSEALLDGEPQAFAVACYTSGMGPLLGFWLKQKLIAASPPIAAVVALQLAHNRLRMECLAKEARAVTEAFSTRGVAATVIKGMHTAFAYFPEPGTRPVSDIDLVIAPSDEVVANEMLTQAGFEPGARGPCPPQRTWRPSGMRVEPRTLCFVHADDPWAIDFQTSLNRRYSSATPIVRLDAAVDEPTEVWAALPSCRVLRQPLMLLQLMVHAGIALGSLTMIRLVELVLVIRAESGAGEAFWQPFTRAAERAGALGVIYPALRMIEELAPGTIPPALRAASEALVPPKVHAVVDRLSPATTQPVVRSVGERLMWTSSVRGKVTQVIREVVLPPPYLSGAEIRRIYYNRLRHIVNRTLTR